MSKSMLSALCIGKPTKFSGAVAYKHQPEVAKFSYKVFLYDPLDDTDLVQFLDSSQFYIEDSIKDFFKTCNGFRIYEKLSVYGCLIENGLQPVSLDYGNVVNRLYGMPNDSTVFGSMDTSASSIEYLIALNGGRIVSSVSTEKFDPTQEWRDLEHFFELELSRCMS